MWSPFAWDLIMSDAQWPRWPAATRTRRRRSASAEGNAKSDEVPDVVEAVATYRSERAWRNEAHPEREPELERIPVMKALIRSLGRCSCQPLVSRSWTIFVPPSILRQPGFPRRPARVLHVVPRLHHAVAHRRPKRGSFPASTQVRSPKRRSGCGNHGRKRSTQPTGGQGTVGLQGLARLYERGCPGGIGLAALGERDLVRS
jgi:hypothetical protein